ncbi:carotenoid biosynthesis protein [Bacillus sp. KH172YL63]|uniref:carotenoid biosynthesis protein n=1 Tax=Bacillus sp. KH172YL63 TaxID=2709784 RepID=UPI0013E5018A|nr:carotenoid biosynthesis protein [Bacillus sp. KH172YL63]BCB04386.1 hypothetical protein KH172YL63_25190 [Bacillus sp. KH172YL63]
MSRKWDDWVWTFFIMWYGVGIILVSLDWLPSALHWANAVFLYLAGGLSIVYASKWGQGVQGVIISLIIMIATIAAESLGVRYGLIFGHYHYERDFGVQFLGVPVTIGFAWVMVILTSMAHFEHFLKGKKTMKRAVIYSSVTSLMAVAMDLIIDPVAYKGREYWIWDEGGVYYDIPSQNFLGWFCVSFVIQFTLYWGVKTFRNPSHWSVRMRQLYFLVIFMFIVTAMVESLWLAVFVTVGIYVISLLSRRRLEKIL